MKRRNDCDSDREGSMAVLSELLKEISYECVCGTTEREITDVIYDSRKVTEGSLFVCIDRKSVV